MQIWKQKCEREGADQDLFMIGRTRNCCVVLSIVTFGVEVPRSVRHALKIDKHQVNNLWHEAIDAEFESLSSFNTFKLPPSVFDWSDNNQVQYHEFRACKKFFTSFFSRNFVSKPGYINCIRYFYEDIWTDLYEKQNNPDLPHSPVDLPRSRFPPFESRTNNSGTRRRMVSPSSTMTTTTFLLAVFCFFFYQHDAASIVANRTP